MKERKKTVWWDYICIIIGTGLVAISIANIYDRIGLVTGGFSGIAIIIKEMTQHIVPGGVPLGMTNLILNIPVFVMGYLRFGKKFVGRTIFGTVMLSLWLLIIPPMDLVGDDYLLSALFGGVFAGIGFGLVFKAKATTGGTDMVAMLIRLKMKQYSVVQIMQVIDGLIVLMGLYVFGIHASLYALVAIFVTTKVSDHFMEGFKSSKAAIIITNHHEEVAKRLMEELDRGVTGLHAKGMYTQEEKCMLYCVVTRKEIVRLKELVNEVDSEAFVIVSDAREVLGEGFLEYSKEF